MKFGFFIRSPFFDPSETFPQIYRDSREQAELADELGFDYIWYPEHHFVTTLLSPAPLFMIVDAAHRTKRARLGAAVILSPFYHPLLLAESLALADQLTEGRLEVAFGRGTYRYEYERLNMTEAEAASRQRECLEALLGLWGNDEEFEFHGKFYDFPPTYPVPRPVQKPHPRIGVAGRTPETLRYVVEHGLDLHTTPLRQPVSRTYANLKLLDSIVADVSSSLGRPVERPPISLQIETVVSDSRAEILDTMRYLQHNYRNAWHFHQGDAEVHKARASGAPLPEGLDVTVEDLASRSVVGSTEEVVRILKQYEEMGFEQFITFMDIGQPQERVLKSMERFAKEVMPHFDNATPARAVRQPVLAGVGARSDGRSPTEVKQELIARNDAEIGSGWRYWEAGEWLAHFDEMHRANSAASGNGAPSGSNGNGSDAGSFYAFDYDCAPHVHADGSGAVIAGGNLMLLRDDACPVCERPIIALYRRWHPESVDQMRARVQDWMREANWHAQHP